MRVRFYAFTLIVVLSALLVACGEARRPSVAHGDISGAVRNAFSLVILKDVVITARDQSSDVYVASTETDLQGNFEMRLQSGRKFRVIFHLDNYIDAVYNNVQVGADQISVLEPILLVESKFAGSDATVSGIVSDAVTGKPLGAMTVILRSGINVRSGESLQQTNSDLFGNYTFNGLESGSYTVEVSANGYIPNYTATIAIAGTVRDNQNIAVSPLLGSNAMRIVLTWGKSPLDLDAHLSGPGKFGGKRFRVDYITLSEDDVTLDVDDQTSYGPETITAGTLRNGTYRYTVSDRINGGSTESPYLSSSAAKVEVYRPGGRVDVFHVPPARLGGYWRVFEIKSGELISINDVATSAIF